MQRTIYHHYCFCFLFSCLYLICDTLNNSSSVLYSNVVIESQCDFTNGTVRPFKPSFTFQTSLVVERKAQKQNSIVNVGLIFCFSFQNILEDTVCLYQLAAKLFSNWTFWYLPMDMSLSELQELVTDREAWYVRFMGSQRVGHDWATELNWTELNYAKKKKKSLTSYQLLLTPNFSPNWILTYHLASLLS